MGPETYRMRMARGRRQCTCQQGQWGVRVQHIPPLKPCFMVHVLKVCQLLQDEGPHPRSNYSSMPIVLVPTLPPLANPSPRLLDTSILLHRHLTKGSWVMGHGTDQTQNPRSSHGRTYRQVDNQPCLPRISRKLQGGLQHTGCLGEHVHVHQQHLNKTCS